MYLSKYLLITIFFTSQALIAMEYPDDDGDKDLLPITLLTDGSEYKEPTDIEEESAITAALQEIRLGETISVKSNPIKKYKRRTKKKSAFLTPQEKNRFLATMIKISETCKLSIELINDIQGNEEKQNMLNFLHQQQNLVNQTLQETQQMEQVPLENIEIFDKKLANSIPDEVLRYLNLLADTMAENIKNRP